MPAMMSAVRALLFICFSPGRFAPHNRGALASYLVFVLMASVSGDRLNPCASLCSLLPVGFRLNAISFAVQAPLKKASLSGWPCGCRFFIVSQLKSCCIHCATLHVDDPPGCPVV